MYELTSLQALMLTHNEDWASRPPILEWMDTMVGSSWNRPIIIIRLHSYYKAFEQAVGYGMWSESRKKKDKICEKGEEKEKK